MRGLVQAYRRGRALLRRSLVEREMEAELAGHLEAEVEQLVANGLSPAVARAQALATMGRLDQIKEECRDARGTAGWEQLRQDLRFGLRRLARERTFSLLAITTVALGVGSATAGFGLLNGVLLRPLAFAEPDRLFAAEGLGLRGPLAVLRRHSQLADYAGHVGARPFTVPGPEGPERQEGAIVSANFFRVLGVAPHLGRTFSDREDQPGQSRVAILSHRFWQERFGGRASALGQRLQLDEAAYEIVGVMPPEFAFPAAAARFWVPLELNPADVGLYWGSGGVSILGRLRTGATRAAAEAELRAWIPRIRTMFPWRMPDAWGTELSVPELRDSLVKSARVQALLLFGVVTLVLLIAVLNVTNLMLGQTLSRRPELAMRAFLGATYGRLTRQLFTEAALLAGLGALGSVGVALVALAALRQWLPPETPRLAEVALDGRALAFGAGSGLLAAVLFGLLPAWQIRRLRQVDSHRVTRTTGGALVLVEAAFATLLLVSAGLLLRSLWTLLQVDPGFATAGLITAEVNPSAAIAPSTARTAALAERLREQLESYAGVRQVAAANVLPLTPDVAAFTAAIEDHPRPPQAPQFPLWSTVATPEHGKTLGIPLKQGRWITPADAAGAPLVVLISEATARRFWPQRSPLGRRLRPVWQNEWRTIVGVVGDIKNYGLTGPPGWVEGEVYLPLAQAITPPPALRLAIRFAGDPAPFAQALPGLVHAVCSACAVTAVTPMPDLLRQSTHGSRSLAWLVTAFALLALAMAAIGIYGVVNQTVLRRTRELGVRMALGARPAQVAWLVLRTSLGQTIAGVAAGLAVAWMLTDAIGSLLYGVAEHDAPSFGAPAALLIAVTLAANAGPLWRALRIDPASALREG